MINQSQRPLKGKCISIKWGGPPEFAQPITFYIDRPQAGRVLVDGIDTRSVGLSTLRGRGLFGLFAGDKVT